MTKMTKLNHAGKKREIVEILIKHFEDSGVEYTCTAVFYKVCHNLAENISCMVFDSGYNFSKSHFYPISSTQRIFLVAANKEYFKRNFK